MPTGPEQGVRAVGVSEVPPPMPEPDDTSTRELVALDAALPPPGGVPWRRARKLAVAIAGALALAAFLVGVGLAFTIDAGTGGDGGHLVSAPLDGRQEVELHLVSGTGVVTVRGADLDGLLYEVSTPPDGDSVPRVVDRGDRIELHLVPTGRSGPAAVEIALDSQVRWQIRLSGGAVEQAVDMRAGNLGGVDFVAGATRIEVFLPPPRGTTTVRVGTGAGELVVHTPEGVPVQARLNSGAGRATIDGETHGGIAPGTVLGSPGWDRAEDRYAIDSGGLGALTVDRR